MTLPASLDQKRSTALLELALLATGRDSIEGVFDAFVSSLAEVTHFDHASLLVYEPDGRFVRLVGRFPTEDSTAEPPRRFDSGETGIARLHGMPDGAEYQPASVPGAALRLLDGSGIQRMWSMPLLVGEECYGIFNIGTLEDRDFPEADLAFLRLAGKLLTGVARNDLAIVTSRKQTQRAALANDLSILLNAGQPVQALVGAVHERLREALAFDYLGVAITRRDDRDTFDCYALGTAAAVVKETMPCRAVYIEALPGWPAPVLTFHLDDLSPVMRERYAAKGLVSGALVPFQGRDELYGFLYLGHRRDFSFAEEDLAFLEVVGTLLSQAVEQQQRLAASREDVARGQVLNQVAVLIDAGESVEHIFERVAEEVRGTLPFWSMSLMLHEGGGWVRTVGSHGGKVFPVGSRNDIAAWGLDYRELTAGPIEAFRLRTDNIDTERLDGTGLQHVLSVALMDGHQFAGLLSLAGPEGHPFTKRDSDFLSVVGTLLGQALASQSHLQLTLLEAEEQRLIAEAAAVVARATSGREIVAGLAGPLARLVPDPYVSFAYFHGDGLVWVHPDRTVEAEMDPVTRRVLKFGQFAIEEISDHLPPGHEANVVNTHAACGTLAEGAGHVVGTLAVNSREVGFVFGPRHLVLLKLLAQIVGPAMENARNAAETSRQRALYELSLASLSEAVILIDHDLRGAYANPAGQRIISAISSEASDLALAVRLLSQEARDVFQRAIAENERGTGRTSLRIDGEVAWLDFEAIPLNHPSYRMLVVASDVTDLVGREAEREEHRRQIEQASRLSALGEIIGGVAHELNNPLTAILGFSELIESDPAATSFAPDLSVIHKEALRARNIVRDLLFIARPGPVEQTEVDLAEVIGHVERLRRGGWTTSGIAVTLDTTRLTDMAWGNEYQLTQVLLNLVTNAEQAIVDTEDPALSISAASTDDGHVAVEVVDNGPGMSGAIIGRIFEPFFTTKQGGGTGLGLSLSYSMVQAHGGRLEVESTPGKGARFRVVLPTYQRADRPPEVERAPLPRLKRVLVVDDEPNLRTVCKRLIESLGHECETASSVKEAIRAAESGSFDLVLCDYRLGAEKADDVISGFQRVCPDLVSRTAIATGATTDAGVVRLTNQHGLTVIAKPYGIAEISELVGVVAG